jgi:3-oxoacyl-[acyl-carrier protein] reductase
MNESKSVALITGASRGIGAACAKEFVANGYTVILNCAHESAAAKELLAEIQKSAPESSLFVGDVSNSENVNELFAFIKSTYGKLDVLVNNAGISKDNLLLRASEEEFMQVLNINLKGAFLCTKAAMKLMLRARKGAIVNMASVVGITGNVGQAAYSASKAGLIGLTKTAAKEGAARNIRCNAVAPGFIETDMTNALSEEVQENIKKNIALGTFGSAKQVAQAVYFLASENSSYITGQVLHVDGGMVM